MNFIKENKTFILLLIFGAICLLFSCGHLSDIYLDVGREIYYPYQILENKVLYKDLFCIYAPFSYLFNALLYKISNSKLWILFLSGGIFSIVSIFIIYLISRKFLTKFISNSIIFFTLSIGVLSTRIFNYTLPYSFGMVYGLCFFLFSLYFLINFIQTEKKSAIYLSSFFLGLSLCSKYDFIPYLIPFLFILFKTKDIKLILKSLLIAFLSLFTPFLFLFFQGLKLEDLMNTFNLIKAFSSSLELKTFYLTQGVYFNINIIPNWIIRIFWGGIFFLTLYFGLNTIKKNTGFKKIFGWFLVSFIFLVSFLFFNDSAYLYLTFLTFLLFLITFKKNAFLENITVISLLSVSIKSVWGLSYSNYGLYYTGLVLLSLFILIKKENLTKSLAVLLIPCGINVLYLGFLNLKEVQFPINSKKGCIKTVEEYSKTANSLIEFIEKTKEDNPKIMIFPEGLLINYLSDKKNEPNGFYSSLIPLYTENFKDKIVDDYKKNKPDYIVLSDMKMYDYGYQNICDSYAKEFCKFIGENYAPYKKINGEADNFLIFKKIKKGS